MPKLPAFKCVLVAIALVLLTACGLPLQSVQVDQVQPAAQATADTAPLEPAATLPPATLAATAAPLPAVLPGGLLATLWDEESSTTALLVVAPATGAALDDYPPIALGEGYSSARSADGQTLAVITYGKEVCDGWAGGTRCQPSDGSLHVIDLAAWTDTATSVRASTNASAMAFSPDGRFLVIGQSQWPDHSVLLVDVGRGGLIDQVKLDFYPDQLRFTADGSGLMVYGTSYMNSDGTNPQTHAALLDAASLSPLWQTPLPSVLDGQYVPEGAVNLHDESTWWMPAVVFAPEAKRLYVVHADADQLTDQLTIVDFAAQTVRTDKIEPAQSWLDRLMALTADVAEAKVLNGTERHAVLSADGPRLYATGAHVDTTHNQYTRTPLGLQVIDTATGNLLDTADTPASFVQLAPGGRHLLLTHWDARAATQIVSVDDLAQVGSLDGFEVQVTRDVTGRPVVIAQRYSANDLSIQVLDPESFTELAAWSAPSALWMLP